ncbi:MAG: ATP-binding protein [Alcaligenaceae bacterium]
MSTDFTPTHEYFIEESLESLAETRRALELFDAATSDLNLISQVFRVIHSIKGTSSTLGITDITALTHHFENSLDYIRTIATSPSALERRHVTALKQSLNEISGHLDIYRLGETPSQEQCNQVIGKLDVLFDSLREGASKQNKLVSDVPLAPATMLAPTNRYQIELFNATQKDIERVTESLIVLGALKNTTSQRGAVGCFELVTTETHDTIGLVCGFYLSSKDIAITLLNETLAENSSSNSERVPNKPASVEINTQLEQSVRVSVGQLIELSNLVDHLSNIKNKIATDGNPLVLADNLKSLDSCVEQLRQLSTQMSHLSLDYLFSKIPSLAQNLATRLEKKVELHIRGGSLFADKFTIEQLNVPLIQLIRNCIDHGIEPPDIRRNLNKSEHGNISLCAKLGQDQLIVELADDGVGLDRQKVLQAAKNKKISLPTGEDDHAILNLIFAPGLTTTDSVTDISGRGVGLDIVKQRIESLKGEIQIESVLGQGTKFIITIPTKSLNNSCQAEGAQEIQS